MRTASFGPNADPVRISDVSSVATGGAATTTSVVSAPEPLRSRESAGPIVLGDEQRDLGAAVAVMLLRALGGEVALDGERLTVRLRPA